MLDQNPTIEKHANRTVITLPKRDIREIANFGWIGIGMGGLAVLIGLAWCFVPLAMAWGALNGGQPVLAIFTMAFAMLGLPGLYLALKALAIGIGVVRNDTWTTISISPHRFVIQEHFWKLSWKRRFKELPSKNLVVDSLSRGKENRERAPIPLGLKQELFALGAQRSKANSKRNEKPIPLVVGYERHVIDAVVDALQTEVGWGSLTVESIVKPTVKDEVKSQLGLTGENAGQLKVDVAGDQESTIEPIEKPGDSIITVEEMDDVTVFRIPAIGILKVGFFFWFSVIWLTFSSIFFFGILTAVWGGNVGGNNNVPSLWLVIPFGSVFIGVGMVLLLAAINIGRRSSVIGVANGLLWIERISIFGKKTIQLESENINTISMRPSGTTVNEVPVMELQIMAADGTKVRMLSQFSDPEIEWMADSLRQLLEIRNKDTTFDSDALTQKAMADPLSIPRSWRIELTEARKSLSIFVRPMAWFAALSIQVPAPFFVAAAFYIFYRAANGNFLANFPISIFECVLGAIFLCLAVLFFGLPFIYTRRKFHFEIDMHSLKVTRYRLKGTDVFEFNHAEIKKIHGGDGSLKVNNEPQPMVEIVRTDGSREAFLMWRKSSMVLFVIKKLNAFRDENCLVENKKSA